MANEAPVVAAPAAAAPAASAPAVVAAPAAGAAPAAAAPAAAAPAAPEAITAAETALASATAAAKDKPADSPEAKAFATAKAALDALKPVAAAKPAPKAPAEYESFKTPQGLTIADEVMAEVKAVAKDLDLSQADAQKLLDKMAPALAKNEAARALNALVKRADDWKAATLADPEIGGERMAENIATALKTFDAFGTPALRETLNKTGLGENPELIRWAYRIGKLIGQDGKIVPGTQVVSASGGSLEARAVSKLWPDKQPAA